MAAPVYGEDLTDIDLAEVGSTGVAINFSGGGGGAPAFGTDLVMQGAGAWDRPVSAAERAIVFNQTPGAGTVAAGVHIYTWLFNGTPGLSDTIANRGAYIVIGTGTGATMQFHVEGIATYGAALRAGKCYVVDYHTTANTGSSPYATKVGTPGATPTYFGAGLKTTAAAKGSNLGVDAIRYGTGAYITAGDSGDPATFLGFSATNDSISNRWGILTNVGGALELKGRFVVGQNTSKTPTAAYFDSTAGTTIVIPNTVHSSTDFSQIIVDHASTTFKWSGGTFQALGTNNRGSLIFNNASTVGDIRNCTFDLIDATTLRAAVVCLNNTWKKCGLITLNAATITDGVIRESRVTSALRVASTAGMAKVTGVSFVDNNSAPTNAHSIELTATGAHTFNNISFSGGGGTPGSNLVVSSGSATADVYNNSGGAITINLTGANGNTPSVRNAAGSTTTVVNAKTVKVTVRDTSGTVIENARVRIEAASGGSLPSDAAVTITRSGSTASVAHTAHGLANGAVVVIRHADQNAYNGAKTISNVTTNAYDYTVTGTPTTPATFTSPNTAIRATALIATGLTTASGIYQITDFNYSSDQPIRGVVRKST